MNLIIFLFLLIKSLTAEEEGVLCTAETCANYINSHPCPSLPDNCRIQNSTHNGVFLPSTDPCHCCEYCLENLLEGDYCAEGEPGGSIPDSICGPGLTCSDGVCVKMNNIKNVANPNPCSKAQGEYDQRRTEGTLGFMELRPVCDDDGFYLSHKCVSGQSCFCLDQNGNRVFGEIPYTSTANLILKCECPRKYNDVLKFFDDGFLHPNQFFRCTETGDYDTIQCIGDKCMCTDAEDGVPTFPTRETVPMSNISKNSLPDCFNKDRHLVGKYYYECADKYVNILQELEDYKKDGYDFVFEAEFPKCDLDGKYAPVQKGVRKNANNEDETYYFCARPDGTPIENYSGTDESKMDCKCARTSLLIPEEVNEKPQCCSDGSFAKIQCRRGNCYCVDSDGYQDVSNTDATLLIEATVNEKEKLFCYKKADPNC